MELIDKFFSFLAQPNDDDDLYGVVERVDTGQQRISFRSIQMSFYHSQRDAVIRAAECSNAQVIHINALHSPAGDTAQPYQRPDVIEDVGTATTRRRN